MKGTGVIAGLGPNRSSVKGLSWEQRFGFAVNRWLPWSMLHFVIEHGLGRHARDPDQTQWRRLVTDGLIKKMCSKDQVLIDDEIGRIISSMRECFIGGPNGYILDVKTILRPWPFDLNSVNGKVQIWNGTDDTNTSIYMARWMANQLPKGSLREFPGDTHCSIFLNRGEEILEELIKM